MQSALFVTALSDERFPFLSDSSRAMCGDII
jgi:hypothetical protein